MVFFHFREDGLGSAGCENGWEFSCQMDFILHFC